MQRTLRIRQVEHVNGDFFGRWSLESTDSVLEWDLALKERLLGETASMSIIVGSWQVARRQCEVEAG